MSDAEFTDDPVMVMGENFPEGIAVKSRMKVAVVDVSRRLTWGQHTGSVRRGCNSPSGQPHATAPQARGSGTLGTGGVEHPH